MKKLRFKQEDGTDYPEWEDSTLGDVATWVNGYAFKPSQLGESGTPVVKIKELLDQDNLSVRTLFSEIPPEQTVLPGELLFSWSMTIAARKWRGEKSYVNQHLYKVSSKPGYDQDCILYGLEANLPQIRRLAHGGTAKHITRPELLSYKIAFPSLSEQERIATFLGLLDERVEAQRVLVKSLEEEKRGYMQAMLSPTPTLRFKQDDGTDYPEWEETTLGAVTDCLDYARRPLSSKERESLAGDVPYYGANNVQGYVSGYLFDEPLVLLAEDGADFNGYSKTPIAQYITGKSWVNNHAHVLRGNGAKTEFIFYSLVHKDIRKFVNGIGRMKLNQSDMKRIPLSLPSLSEQARIAGFLGLLDDRLLAERVKLTALELEKRAFAQRVFL